MLTIRIALAAALLAVLTPAAVALMTTEGDRKTACVQHVRASGVPGAAEAAANVCSTDYIKRYAH